MVRHASRTLQHKIIICSRPTHQLLADKENRATIAETHDPWS